MGSSIYNNLVYKVQSLEEKLNRIKNGTRDSHDSSDIYLTNKPQRFESIQNLLVIVKNIKHELHYLLKCTPENRKTLKMYNEVCILESELYNLLNCFQPLQNTNRKLRVYGSKDSRRVLNDTPKKISFDNSDISLKNYYGQHTPLSSHRYFENLAEPEYIVKRKHSGDSLGASSYYCLSSSSSEVTIDRSREPLNIRKPKSSYQDQPSAVSVGQTTPIYVKKSRGSSERKKDKKKARKPILKKSSLKFDVRKSDSNKMNASGNDLQTQDTEVFLVKKKRKPRSREQSDKNRRNGRYFVSRLKKVMSSKSRPRDSKKKKSSKRRKSSTPEHNEEKYYIRKSDKKRFGLSKYKEDSPKYSEDSLSYSERKRKKKPFFRKRFGSKKHAQSRRSRDSEPVVVVARSSNLSNNPFYDESQIFYLHDSSLILLPKTLSSKNLHFPRNHDSEESYSERDKEIANRSFIRSVEVSNDHKKSNISYTDSNYEFIGSNQNSNSYLKENDIQSDTYKKNDCKSGSKCKLNSKAYKNVQENFADRRINKYDSLSSDKKYGSYNSNMTSKYKNNDENSTKKFILLKVVDGSTLMFEDKGSKILNTRNKDANISRSKRLVLNKDNNPFGVNATAPSIYLAQSTLQNPLLLKNTNHPRAESYIIVNSTFENIENKESPKSKSISNSNHLASLLLKSSPSGKSINNKIHTGTLNKSGSKIFPVKTFTKDMENSHSETRGLIAPLQNTKSVSLAEREAHRTLGNESHTDVFRSMDSNQSSTGKKTKQWFPRSLSKLSIISRRGKKTRNEKNKESLTKEPSKNNLLDVSNQPSSEKISKAKSWTSLKHTVSGVGSLMKLGKTKKTEKQAALKKVGSEKKLKTQPSLLKRVFSKAKMSDNTAETSSNEPISTSGYEGDKTSISNHSPNNTNTERLHGNKLNGYQVGSRVMNQDSKAKKNKRILASNTAKSKKLTLKDNPEAFNYSLHYSKEKHKCVEMDVAPSILCLVDSGCPQTMVKSCGSKTLWSKAETILSEHELSDFEKHNKYHEIFFKPNKCKGCTIHDKKVSKFCQKRGERKSSNSQSLNTVCSDETDQLNNHPIYSFKSIPGTTSDHFVSDSSDFCDWKKIANEIKECH